MAEQVRISPPWVTYARKVHALFERDPAVSVLYDGDRKTLKLMVAGAGKAEAIARIMPERVVFGNVTMYVTVVPANEGEPTIEQTFRDAFDGNPVVSGIQSAGMGEALAGRCYVSFVPEVAQFFNDDISSPSGVTTMTYGDLAEEVFDGLDGVSFCVENVGNPVWP